MTAIPADKEGPQFSDVYVTETRAYFAKGYDPTFEENIADLELKNLVSVDRSQALISKTDGTGRFRVFFKFGAKWSYAETKDSTITEDSALEDPESEDAIGLITIECEIVAEFSLIKRYEQAELDDFALHEAVNYVIPYWKNYLISQCSTMRLQELVLPEGG
jgi:hypothetical protein